jgi:hypothetical protein
MLRHAARIDYIGLEGVEEGEMNPAVVHSNPHAGVLKKSFGVPAV